MADRDRDRSQHSDKDDGSQQGQQGDGQKGGGGRQGGGQQGGRQGSFSEGDWGDNSTRVSDTHEPPDPPEKK